MSVAKQIAERVRQLTPAQQQSVLSFAHAIGPQSSTGSLPPGAKLNDLLAFAGCIPPEDLKEMERAIDEAFEQVNPDEW